MSKNIRPHIQLPLKLFLIVPFVTQIFAIVGLVGYLSFQNGQKAVDTLADELIDKTNTLVSDHLDSYLSIPQTLNQINADAVKLGLLDVKDPEKATKFFWHEMQAYDVTYIGYGLTTGAGAGVAKYDGKTITLEEWTNQLPNNVSNYAADNQGNRAGLNEKFDFDNFNETWYNEPIRADKPIWSRIYLWNFPGGYPYITASAGRPLYDANNRLLGMIAADIHLLKLSDFLRELKISPSGQIFIVERNGMLIANSGKTEPFILKGEDIERINVTQSADPIMQAITQQLQQTSKSWDISTKQDLDFKFQTEQHYVRLQPWHDEYGLDWVVVTVIPESDFMAEINANRRTTILLCLGALVLATILGVVTAQRISRPLFKLSQASQKLAISARKRFSTDQAPSDVPEVFEINLDKAGIQELDSLADSFTLMAQQLQQTFNELETFNEELEERVGLRTQELQNTLQELHRTQAQMLQSEKMSALGQMVAGVAHEVNNPINFIYGNLKYTDAYVKELLELIALYQQKYTQADDEIDELAASIDLEFLTTDLPKLIASMRIGSERIREIVKSLRTFSRLDESDFKTADIHEGIDSTLMILQHRTKDNPNHLSIQIIKDYDDLLPIECYPGQLNQVFMNILSNAIDALEPKRIFSENGATPNESVSVKLVPQDPPTIRIQTRKLDDQWITITITDNGSGIPEEVQSRLFDPFFTTKPVGQGTGMGLAISYEIITKRHQGHLSVTSKPGEGATFEIKIPCQQSESTNVANLAVPEPVA